MPRRLEPVTSVGYPPSKEEYGNGGCDGPPQREQEIGQEAEDREDHPDYFFLHWECLAEHFRRGGAILRKSAKREVVNRRFHSEPQLYFKFLKFPVPWVPSYRRARPDDDSLNSGIQDHLGCEPRFGEEENRWAGLNH
jgi:hypothetical protein